MALRKQLPEVGCLYQVPPPWGILAAPIPCTMCTVATSASGVKSVYPSSSSFAGLCFLCALHACPPSSFVAAHPSPLCNGAHSNSNLVVPQVKVSTNTACRVPAHTVLASLTHCPDPADPPSSSSACPLGVAPIGQSYPP